MFLCNLVSYVMNVYNEKRLNLWRKYLFPFCISSSRIAFDILCLQSPFSPHLPDLPPFSTYTRGFFSFFNQSIKSSLHCSNIPGCVAFHQNVGATLLKKSDPLSLNNYQFPVAPSLGLRLLIHCPSLGWGFVSTSFLCSGIIFVWSLHKYCACCHPALSPCVHMPF